MKSSSIYDCAMLPLSKVHNRAGNLTVIEGEESLPFSVSRIYYLYDIPGGETRGGHAHKECHQVIIAVSGSFEIEMDDGKVRRTVVLNRPYYGLHLPPGIWASEKGFSSGAVCLVLASHKYDESDYIRQYDEFVTYRMPPVLQPGIIDA